ncbi:MAG: 50S ribosomal protein L21 [Myxococcota bacterium]|jgi:large subunit ribosomal protein L21|nr:50S ribosomal protein L21 [Myxococcota bacterium]
MYAIVAVGGKQYRVNEGTTFTVDRVDAEVGSTLELAQVLAIGGDEPRVGTPVVENAKVQAEVLAHPLGTKREAFKYRRTRRSRVSRGSRPRQTTLRVTAISA